MIEHLLIRYNYIGEAAGLLLACFLLVIMLYTNPKNTYVFRFIFSGNIVAIFSISINIAIIVIANNPEDLYNRELYMFLLLTFLILYMVIMFCIFSYVNLMSIVRRKQRKEFLLMSFCLGIMYIIAVAIMIASRGLYEFELEMIDICRFTRFYCWAGIICAIFSLNATLTNRLHVSRIIKRAVYTLVPCEVAILLAQIILVERIHTIFSSITYVPVFALGYILFHASPYDEISGCQSINALIDSISKRGSKKKYYISYVRFVMPGVENLGNDGLEIILRGVEACREVEMISSRIRLYRAAEDKIVAMIDVEDEQLFLRYADRIRGVMDSLKTSLQVPFNYLMIAGGVPPELDSAIKVRQFFEYVSRKYYDHNNSIVYITKAQDYDDFADDYAITLALRDIRNRMDLEDERILVYAQPIYSVETGSFRVAEALTRMKLGDRIISPDKFIHIAEASGTVHALTCIVLDKVCRAIQTLDEFYDFDAISINCSSKELSQEKMYQDLLDIIEKYDFDVGKIRLEVTESAMFENYEAANENMNALNRAGIHLYLDDFGTGYSSLERVMNCPFKTIKFDKTLLYKSLDDDRMDDIITYMIEVFKKNGFITLVEGVEDENQSQYSLEHGFDYIQGYHYAKPEPIDELKKYFSRKAKF